MRPALLLSLMLLPLSVAAVQPDLERLATVPQALLPAAEVKQLIEQHKAEPLRYAVTQALALDQRNGAWDEASPGIARWRLRISSEGARSLSLNLRDVQLPAASELWLYAEDGRDLQGPFTAADLRDGAIWLPLVRSSAAVLEARVPAQAASALRLRIVEAMHGYRPLRPTNSPKAAIGEDSGSCNINVVCPAGNSWRNEIRATVLITTSGGSLCSGTLMNNTRLDDQPLILTANHCGIRSSANAIASRFYFNVESGSCAGNDDGRVDQNLAGGSFLARDSNSDFTLVTLSGAVPASYNALYAGWDARSTATPSSGVAIHHPSGDEKKISVYSSSASKVEDEPIGSGPGSFTVDAWQVQWAQGTTEGGSSGSALWNQDKRVVGVLSGGGASCSDRTAPDFFARLDRGWTGGGTSATRLRDHLDPTNSGALTLNSKEAGSSTPLPDSSADSGGGAFGALLLLLPVWLRRRRSRAAPDIRPETVPAETLDQFRANDRRRPGRR